MTLAVLIALTGSAMQDDWVTYQGDTGPGHGKKVVLLAGDEEYRSEEALPQLAKILAFRHGFTCTVLFSVDADGTINPDRRDHQPGLSALDDADLCVLMLRFRSWPEEQMAHFARFVETGKPLVGLRTSTHAFDGLTGRFERYSWQSKSVPGGFGRHTLGETWLSHWGDHGTQATLARTVSNHPVVRGVGEIFVTTDVYEAHPPPDSTVLARGEVVAGMRPGDPSAQGEKKDSRGKARKLNDPPMPVAWVREPVPGQRVFTTTMGSATDLLDEDFRRLIVNSVYWAVGLEVPVRAESALWGNYQPSPYGFGKWRRGVRPADLR